MTCGPGKDRTRLPGGRRCSQRETAWSCLLPSLPRSSPLHETPHKEYGNIFGWKNVDFHLPQRCVGHIGLWISALSDPHTIDSGEVCCFHLTSSYFALFLWVLWNYQRWLNSPLRSQAYRLSQCMFCLGFSSKFKARRKKKVLRFLVTDVKDILLVVITIMDIKACLQKERI